MTEDLAARDQLIAETEAFVKAHLAADRSGHDWWHVHRVRLSALHIAEAEGARPFEVELAALLHDVDDHKFSRSLDAGGQAAERWLSSRSVDEELVRSVGFVVRGISFRGPGLDDVELSIEGRCVRDADRLDAMGAIGIARVFAYGASIGQPIYVPPHSDSPVREGQGESFRGESAISHFQTKLLQIRDRMGTRTGRKLAERRHQIMVRFLEDFFNEWNGKDLE